MLPLSHEDGDSIGFEATSLRDPVIGSEVSGYRVTSRLGMGGMGIVYEGEQPVIGKRVAIKVLRHEVADNPDVVERLVSEARAVNKVGHRGIVDVFGFGQLPDGRQCIVMEFLDGEPLEAVVATSRKQKRLLPLNDVLVILDEVLSALSSAHTAGVIHRDLKPSNIFLCRQRDGSRYVKLLDFGIAKLGVLGHTPATRASIMLGTPAYMAPEQANGGIVGPAMDLYALGVLAFELLTGQQPFTADSVVEMLMKHARQMAPRVSSLNPAVPEALDVLVAQLLEKRPELRPESADAVRQQIVKLKKLHSSDGSRHAAVSIEVKPASVERSRLDLADTQKVPSTALESTAVVAKTKEFNTTSQRAPTAQQLEPVRSIEEEPLEAVRSKTPLFVVGGLTFAALVGVSVMLVGGSTSALEAPLRPDTQPPAPVIAAGAASKLVEENTVQAVKAPERGAIKPAEQNADGAATAAPVNPQPGAIKPIEQHPADPIATKPVAAVRVASRPMEPKQLSHVATTQVEKRPTTRLNTMVRKLDMKLTAKETAGENVALLRKTLDAVKSKLTRPELLSKDDLESLEVTLLRLEEETSSL